MQILHRIRHSDHVRHETKSHVLFKFLVLLFILVAYTGYLSWEYGLATGGALAAITWSFFVLCTPVADAGMLLDFPIRLLFKVRMWITELLVWVIAIGLNGFYLWYNPAIYEKSLLGHIFHGILQQPYPYWSVIILSGMGTFLSVRFADELLDYVKFHEVNKSQKYHLIFEGIVMLAIFTLIVVIYNVLLHRLGIEISTLKAK